jgi:hypothetical protein
VTRTRRRKADQNRHLQTTELDAGGRFDHG